MAEGLFRNMQPGQATGTKTEEQMLADRAQQRITRAVESVQGLGFRSPSENLAGQIGATLGAMFANKFNPAQLTPEQQQELAIRKRTMELLPQRIEKVEAETEAPISEERKATEALRAQAAAFYEAGDIEMYTRLVTHAAELDDMRRRAQHELAILGEQARSAPERTRHELAILGEQAAAAPAETLYARMRAAKAEAGEDIAFYPTDPQGRILEGVGARAGRLTPEGTLMVPGQDGVEREVQHYVPADIAHDAMRLRAQQEQNALAAGEAARVKWGDLYDNTEQREARQAGQDIRSQAATIGDIANIFESLLDQNVNPDTIVGTQGQLLQTVDRIRAAGGAFVDYAQTALKDDETGETVFAGDINSDRAVNILIQRDPTYESIFNRIQVPRGITGAEEQAKYRSAVVQYAYAVWRSMEGQGARQASNQDFQVALEAIGAASGTARGMLSVSRDMMRNAFNKYNARVSTYRNVGAIGGYDPEYVDQRLFGGTLAATEAANAALERVDALLGRLDGIDNTGEEETTGAPAPPQQSGGAIQFLGFE